VIKKVDLEYKVLFFTETWLKQENGKNGAKADWGQVRNDCKKKLRKLFVVYLETVFL
jgi:hypothetical protein